MFARRDLAHVRHIPEKLIDVTLQPLMFVLLFAYVFGGVIHVPGGSYHEYLLGGIAVQTLAFGMMGPGIAISTDLGEGIVDRFRSLPMARSAYLLGHLLAELAASMVAIAVLTITGLRIGWHLQGLPSGLRAVAEYNPISAFSAAIRTLFGNPTAIPHGAPWPLQHSVLASVLWCAVLLAVAIPGTLRAFRRRTTD